MTGRFLRVGVCLVVVTSLAWGLYDPPWVDGMTQGLRPSDVDSSGVAFRWTSGHATFYVPRGATTMTLSWRVASSPPEGGLVAVRIDADDERLAVLTLDRPGEWQRSTVTLPRTPTHRRTRRIDLRTRRTVGESNLGVQLAAIEWQ